MQGRTTDEADLLLQACFEHYPAVRGTQSFDPALARTMRVCGWALFQDTIQARVQSEQQHALLAYLPFAAMATHYDFASTHNAVMRWPRAQFEFEAALRANSAVLSECVSGFTAALQRAYSPRVFRLDAVRNGLADTESDF